MAPVTELILIRHAPTDHAGRLAGRHDVPARLPDAETLASLRAGIGDIDRLAISPARRCRQTAKALFPDFVAEEDPRLWEQDFGRWEGRAMATLPDHGALSRPALAMLRPPGGESFADLHARCAPALEALCRGGRVAVVAHAGTIRVALSLALGARDAGLAFVIAPLSRTGIQAFGDGQWAISGVNIMGHG